jgi:predicted lactoylglutathione lyase
VIPSPVTDKAFVPAKDLERSKQFYTDLGFSVNWSGADIAELQIGSFTVDDEFSEMRPPDAVNWS